MAKNITRREFIKLSAAAGAAAAVLAGCGPTRSIILEPYVRPPEEQLAGEATWYASTCRMCPAGCGIIVRIMNGRALKIEGNPEHPLNQGKLCARGQSSLQLLYNPDRLTSPVNQTERGSRKFTALDHNAALNLLTSKLIEAGNAVAIWDSASVSGHLLDLYQRFLTGIGAPPPLLFDLYTTVFGYRNLLDSSEYLFNQRSYPVFNLGQADVVLSFGADLLGTGWSSTRYGLEFGQFRSHALGKQDFLIQFEPRLSITAANADAWVPIRPGTEAMVAQGIASIIANEALGSSDRFERAKAMAPNVDIQTISNASEIAVDDLRRFARYFAEAQNPLAIPGTPVAEKSKESISAVQVLNLIAGQVGRPGGLWLSPESPLSSLVMAEPSSINDLKNMIGMINSGQVKVLLIHGVNPIFELPQELGVLDALKKVPFVVSFSSIVDETGVWSDLILPERSALESWGYKVVSPGFDEPVLSSQQPVVRPLNDVFSAADGLLAAAKSIPKAATSLPWADEVAFLKDTIGKLPAGAVGGSGSELIWERYLQHGGWWPAQIAQQPTPTLTQAMKPLAAAIPSQFEGDEQNYPYYLYLFLSDLLSDGIGASIPWLQGSPDTMTTISWQTWVELNPDTAKKLDLNDGDVVKVTSPRGEIEAPVYVYPAIRPDTVAIPFGQGHTDYGRFAKNRGSNPIELVAVQDESGLAWSTMRVKITPTGKKVTLALFENKLGTSQTILNFPG